MSGMSERYRVALVHAVEALEVGDQALATLILLDAIEGDDNPLWPGQRRDIGLLPKPTPPPPEFLKLLVDAKRAA